jgi:hypothetical protein
MPTTTGGAAQSGAPEEKRPSNTVELEDGRQCWRFWVPAYVLEQFAETIGQRGVALYCSLAWWLCRRAPHRRPKLAEIGQRAGCSRATVWRGLKELETAGLVEIVPQVGPTGRRPHKIRLVHPAGVTEEDEDSGMGSAGGINMSARRAQPERAARSNCARGALDLSAPSLFNKDPNVCVNGNDTHTSDPSLPKNAPSPPAPEEFSRRWMEFLRGGTPNWRASHKEESYWVGGALIAQGWTLAELVETLAAPERPVNEWPREYAARHGAEALKAVRESAKAVEQRQQRAKGQQSATAKLAACLRLHSEYDKLPADRRAAIEAEVLQLRPELVARPGILRLMALEIFSSQVAGDSAAPANSSPATADNGRAAAE